MSSLLLMLGNVLQASAPYNGGFEDGLDGWLVGDAMSEATADAAHSGKQGLRVVDNDKQHGSGLHSGRYAVRAGQEITVSFDAKADANFLGVYIWPVDANDKLVGNGKSRGNGIESVAVKSGDGSWKHYSVSQVMPEGAVAFSIWVHSWSSATGTSWLDNFEITGLAEGAQPLQRLEEMQAASQAAIQRNEARLAKIAKQEQIPETLPERAQPPVIILKLDDLRQIDGQAHHLWTKVSDYMTKRNIKHGIGIITETLEVASPDYIEWIQQRQESGLVEIWFHGWDHGVWKDADGRKRSEFSGRSEAEQHERFAKSQALAKEKLGFALQTFGPGGGGSGAHQDEATAKAMAEDPDMRVWLYPSPIDEMGRSLAAEGKVTVLDRVWAVNLEASVGQPNYKRFVAGYAKNSDREYFVLQGHPMHWGGARWSEFEKIIDFLVEQEAVFMTPAEYAASLDGKPAQQVAQR
ncbi:carbohydrate binding domain-containing protein [Cerasicoccus frondis]|uniref:carbohydrate binding domain-containing protein n=1 Tax=Cerasicoccus frondis TaxID=490090 RepID=UPI0028525EA2|nr:carbohydrate binding domain-containing protein [Cerasicoccus frondis]